MYSHECELYLNQQEKELKVLEIIRNGIQSVIKSDIDYSNNLNSITINGSKLSVIKEVDNSLGNFWHIISKEIQLFSKMIKKKSEIMSLEILQILDSVISERKFLRREYKEDLERLINKSKKLQQHLNKIKNDYHSCINLYLISKMKYENKYHGSSARNLFYSFSNLEKRSKKFCSIKDGYIKSARKLHLLHNDYIFAIKDLNNFIFDLENYLLPNLNLFLDILLQQSEQLWKELLKKFLNLIDFRRQNLNTTTVRTNENFKLLVKKDYKRVNDDTEIVAKMKDVNFFKFDEELLKCYSGSLKENRLAVDSFTYETLKSIEIELQSNMIKCQQEVEANKARLKLYEAEIEELIKLDCNAKFKALPIKSRQAIVPKRKTVEYIRKAIIELECKHERYHKKWELIQSEMVNIDSDTIPSGLQLEAPFKSSSSAPALITDINARNKNKWVSYRSTCLKSPSETFNQYSGSSLRYFFINKFRGSSTSSSANPSSPLTSDKKCQNCDDLIKTLDNEEWFHGTLPREEVAKLLFCDGDFLVRESYSKGDKRFVISVKWNASIKHFLIHECENGYFKLETLLFKSISAMIYYYLNNGVQISTKTNAMIINPINKENWVLNYDEIELKEVIGHGKFGDVHRGVWIRKSQNLEYFDVAIKKCNKNLPDEHKKRLLEEARILKQYNHPNIVKFIGVCAQKQPIMLVLELASEGTLLNYLRNKNNQCYLKVKDLISMCLDIAKGMDYLQNRKCIHRNLSARNCLITKEKVVKISDFGMSLEIFEEDYVVLQEMNLIPIKWTAPEALNYGRYTMACDVWSFGVLMWEVFSFGGVPYSGMSNSEARELIENGYRLPSSANTPIIIYNLMIKCWSYDPSERPTFTKLILTIEKLRDKKIHF